VIASSDCSKGLSCCVKDKELPAAARSAHRLLTKEIFLKIVGDTTRNDAIYHYVVESLSRASIETEYQIAAYLSQLLGETKFFEAIESSVLEKDDNQLIGNNQTGDGRRFRGRGGIMLRGRMNYALAQKSPRLTGKFEQ
jgi:predicted chitinase